MFAAGGLTSMVSHKFLTVIIFKSITITITLVITTLGTIMVIILIVII